MVEWRHLVVTLCFMLRSPPTLAAEEPFRTLTPAGSIPHPAVLFVPGCSGFSAHNGVNDYDQRAVELQAAGYTVVFVDYVGRRMQTNCAHISLAEVATDILDTAVWIRTQLGVDASRVSVIGWSYGGGGVLAALKATPPEPLIAKAVMYYPVCRGAAPWSAVVPVLMLLGGKDDIAYPGLCESVLKGAPTDRLQVITYPEAHHGFDLQGLPERASPPPGSPMYNAEAAKASWTAVLEFLK